MFKSIVFFFILFHLKLFFGIFVKVELTGKRCCLAIFIERSIQIVRINAKLSVFEPRVNESTK